MTNREISNTDDIIDVRDIIERIEDIEGNAADGEYTAEDVAELNAAV